MFSAEEDEKLIENVAKFPIIFDTGKNNFKLIGIKENAWREVAECVLRSVDDCKKRWRNIKDTYKKRQKKPSTGSSASQNLKLWPLLPMLKFLDVVEYERESISNVVINIESSTSNSVFCTDDHTETEAHSEGSSSAEPPKKRGRQDRILSIIEENRHERTSIMKRIIESRDEDDVDLFFKSMAKSVKKLPPRLISKAKIQSLQLLSDLEEENEAEYLEAEYLL